MVCSLAHLRSNSEVQFDCRTLYLFDAAIDFWVPAQGSADYHIVSIKMLLPMDCKL